MNNKSLRLSDQVQLCSHSFTDRFAWFCLNLVVQKTRVCPSTVPITLPQKGVGVRTENSHERDRETADALAAAVLLLLPLSIFIAPNNFLFPRHFREEFLLAKEKSLLEFPEMRLLLPESFGIERTSFCIQRRIRRIG